MFHNRNVTSEAGRQTHSGSKGAASCCVDTQSFIMYYIFIAPPTGPDRCGECDLALSDDISFDVLTGEYAALLFFSH